MNTKSDIIFNKMKKKSNIIKYINERYEEDDDERRNAVWEPTDDFFVVTNGPRDIVVWNDALTGKIYAHRYAIRNQGFGPEFVGSYWGLYFLEDNVFNSGSKKKTDINVKFANKTTVISWLKGRGKFTRAMKTLK